jgi:3',5'-cyclic AMP phosphodiesterase CpdA
MLTIALMGDLHYPQLQMQNEALLEAREKFFPAYLKSFMGTKADFHISVGDLSHMGLAEEFEAVRRLTENTGGALRFVLGNHDVLALPKNELLPVTRQPRYGSVETERALLVFLDTTKELELHGWGLDAEQWEWLQWQMELAPDKTMMVFAHHPVPDTTSGSPKADAGFMPLQDIHPLLQKRKGTSFYFNGHTHTHSIARRDQWHFIQTAAALCHPCFRLIELNGREVRIRTISLEEEPLSESGKLLHDQLKGFHRPKNFTCEPSDLEVVVPLW